MNRPEGTLPPGCDPDSIVLTFPVAREHAGLRLDRFLQTRIPRISRTRAQAIVRKCAYRADGSKRRPSERVKAGETVLIVRPPMNEPPTPQSYGVLYEDEDVLVVNKPAGLPMHPTATYYRNTLSYLLQQNYPEAPPQFAHRLDKETSGVVICGKHEEAEVALKTRFENRQVFKEYVAIARGDLAEDQGIIELPIGPVTEGLHLLMEVREDARQCRTEYTVLGRREGAFLIRMHPLTGRQHQLRVHLAALGHPIIGDKLYGPDAEKPFLQIIEEGWTPGILKDLGHPRHALHAARLRIAHPRGGELELEAPLPDDFTKLWESPGRALAGDPVCGWEVITGGEQPRPGFGMPEAPSEDSP